MLPIGDDNDDIIGAELEEVRAEVTTRGHHRWWDGHPLDNSGHWPQ